MAEGYWHSFPQASSAEALRAFQRAYDLVKDNLAINFHTAEALPLLATALRLQADATQGENHRQSQQLRNRALKFARWATRITRLFPAYYPYSLRELSLQLAARGQTKKAHKYAEKSLAVAESQMARFEHAQSLLVWGKLASQLGLPEAAEQIRAARRRDRSDRAAARRVRPSRGVLNSQNDLGLDRAFRPRKQARASSRGTKTRGG